MNSSTHDSTNKPFISLIKESRLGKFKVYIGMSPGVGKTYRMLQESHVLIRNGIDVKIGYIETHARKDLLPLLDGLPIIPRKKIFYKGKEIEEMDVVEILNQRPEVVIVDELAHSNIEGSQNEKRWQDVMDILAAGISVISALNIQHIESLQDDIKRVTGIDVAERVPDSVLAKADEVVNIDLTADELIARLKEGRIYSVEKVPMALKNFFQSDNILQLRELALKEVASQVERKVEKEVTNSTTLSRERFLACISTNDKKAQMVIRKTARLANYYNANWYVLYVQRYNESALNIELNKQQSLLDNFKLATELGAEIIKIESDNIINVVLEQANERKVTFLCVGFPRLSFISLFFVFRALLNGFWKKFFSQDFDVLILS